MHDVAWHQIAEASLDAFLVVAGDGTIVQANSAAARLFQWPRDELIGASLDVLLPARVRAGHRATLAGYVADPHGRPLRHPPELVVVRRDGAEIPVDISMTPLATSAGTCVLAAVRDVSDRVDDLAARSRAEAALRELFECSPDAVLVADPTGRYVDVNQAACALLGYRRDELLGKTTAEIIAPEDQPRRDAARARLTAHGVEQGEWTLLHRDGQPVATEIRAAVLADGRWIAFVRDISERRRAEAELRQAERARARALRELEAVLEQCPVGIIVARTPDGSAMVRNRLARDLVEGEAGLSRLRDAAGVPLPLAAVPLIRALAGEHIAREELQVRTPSGREIPIEAYAAPVRDEAGAIEGAVVAVQDITAVKEIERLRVEWNAVVAHDLRQPLNAMRLNVELLARDPDATPATMRRVEVLRTMIARLNRMAGDLLDLARLDARRMTIERHPLDIGACVRDAVERAAPQAPDRRFVVAVDAPSPVVLGDGDRIAQVVENLLSNAIKYGDPGTPIRVEVAGGGRRDVTVAVSNDGPPIPAADLARVFQRFVRAGIAAHRAVPGIGLGLQIAQALVEAHGGHIAVDSGAGRPTTFRFTLPVGLPLGSESGLPAVTAAAAAAAAAGEG